MTLSRRFSAPNNEPVTKGFNPESLPQHDADANGLGELIRVAGLTRLSFQVHFGLIASGDEDVVDPVRAAELLATTNALCVAWEGSGGARAARMNGIGFLEIRGVTDAADAQAANCFHSNVSAVMSNVVDVLLAWCTMRQADRTPHAAGDAGSDG